MIYFGSVDDPATIKKLKMLMCGDIGPDETLESSVCRHCSKIVMRKGTGFEWRHYPSLKEECGSVPMASPMRDAAGNVIRLIDK